MRKHTLRNQIQIAIVGGNGFLGRAIVKRLSNYQNLRIFSLDKRQHNVPINTEGISAIVQQISIDVGNEGAISSWLSSTPVDVILFCAGYEHPTAGLSDSVLDDTKALLALNRTLASLPYMDLSEEDRKPYFMYISSTSVYGDHKNKLIDESTFEAPTNHSGMNKLLAEDLVQKMCTKFGSKFCILRPSEVYGRRHHNELSNSSFWPGYLNYFVERIVKKDPIIQVASPATKLDLVNINYFTKVVVECIKSQLEGIYNITSEEPISIIELVEKIADKYTGTEPIALHKIKTVKVSNTLVSSDKIKALVPYEASKYDLDGFIKSYIPIRQFEIGKQMAIEVALREPVTLDMAALKAKDAYKHRMTKRELEYKKIKEIAGPKFFEIKVGCIQERSQVLLGEEYERDLKASLELKAQDQEEFYRHNLDIEGEKEVAVLKVNPKPRKLSKKELKDANESK